MFKSMMIQEYDDYSDAYILVSSRIIMDAERADDAAKRTDKSDRKVIFKIFGAFNECIREKTISQQMILKKLIK